MTNTKTPGELHATSVRPDSDEWNLARFERWVRTGVESYVLENAGPAAFPEAAHLILGTGSLTMGLRAFAEGLNASRRDNLKQAVAQALSSLEPLERFVPVAEQLLAIAVSISAYPVLEVLATKIGDGFFGQPDDDGRDSLFAMTIYSVARLSTPSRQDAKRCLQELIGRANFKPAHASAALIALCQVDKRGLAEHLSTPGLRPKLTEQFKLYDPDGAIRKRAAQEILAIIGLINLKDALHDLAVLDPSAARSLPDDWLAEALLFSPGGPLKLAEEGSELTLALRTDSNVFVPLERRATKSTSRRVGIGRPPSPRAYGDLANTSTKQLAQEVAGWMAHLFYERTNSYAAHGAAP